MQDFNNENRNSNSTGNDNSISNDINRKGVWSPVAIKVICILFSYLAVFIFFIMNYIRLGHPKDESRVKLLTITALAYILLTVAIPQEQSIYYSPFFIIMNAVLGIIICNDQKELYVNYIASGGKKNSTLSLTFLSIGLFIGVVTVVGMLVMAMQMMAGILKIA